MLKIGIVGFGFMGRTHYRCWQGHGQVVAICDKKADLVSDSNQSKGNIDSTADKIDFDKLKLYTNLDEMLACESLDAISLTLPTWLHVDSCAKALAAGVHVLCEKPMALNVPDCRTMMTAAQKSGKILQIGHCVRFWPEYAATKKMIAGGKYGRVLAGSFTRLCSRPTWGDEDWFMDETRSGGMVLDLHIHDTDYVQYLFGMPSEVYSAGVKGPGGLMGHIVTHYDYGDNKVITAEAGWLLAGSFGFEMSFNIVLEKATITYDCNRQPAFKVCLVEGQSFTPAVAAGDGYSLEVAHFARAISGAKVEDVISLEQSCNSVRIIEAEKKSLLRRQKEPVL